MIESVSDEMVDTFALAGTTDEVRAQLGRWDDLDVAVLFPPTFQLGEDEIAANHRALVSTFAGS